MHVGPRSRLAWPAASSLSLSLSSPFSLSLSFSARLAGGVVGPVRVQQRPVELRLGRVGREVLRARVLPSHMHTFMTAEDEGAGLQLPGGAEAEESSQGHICPATGPGSTACQEALRDT